MLLNYALGLGGMAMVSCAFLADSVPAAIMLAYFGTIISNIGGIGAAEQANEGGGPITAQ